MVTIIREAGNADKETFVDFTLALSRFNRMNHPQECKYDDFAAVLKALKKKAEETFRLRNNNHLILLAEMNSKPVGYALGRIIEQNKTADNGTGSMGLFDELYVSEAAQGKGVGQKLVDAMLDWMKLQGIHRIKLQAYAWNNPALALYEKNGFRPYAISLEKYI